MGMSQARWREGSFYIRESIKPNRAEIRMTPYELDNGLDSSAMERTETKTVVNSW